MMIKTDLCRATDLILTTLQISMGATLPNFQQSSASTIPTEYSIVLHA